MESTRSMLKSKIHRATVTEANVDYEGSITIDAMLMEEANILPFEQVHVLDVNNGARLKTYAIEGEWGSGVIAMNGAAARLIEKGDTVIILTYTTLPESAARDHQPQLVYVNEHNEMIDRSANGHQPSAVSNQLLAIKRRRAAQDPRTLLAFGP